MLDLTSKKNKYYQLKWTDGEVLTLKPPTQRLYKKIQEVAEITDEFEVIQAVYETISEIINNNTDRRVIENVSAELTIDMCLMVINDYFEYYTNQMNENVVFRNTQQTMN